MKEIKIAYLHGLESNNIGIKNDWLRTLSEVFDPLIDYSQPDIYQKIKNDIISFKPDIIIGSSMGGFFAYNLAKERNIPSLLFNPALHSRSYTPDMTGNENSGYCPEMFFVLGQNDDMIDPLKTVKIIAKDGYTDDDYIILSHGHRTPYEIFTQEIKNFINRIQKQ